jgi:hypothetical protein
MDGDLQALLRKLDSLGDAALARHAQDLLDKGPKMKPELERRRWSEYERIVVEWAAAKQALKGAVDREERSRLQKRVDSARSDLRYFCLNQELLKRAQRTPVQPVRGGDSIAIEVGALGAAVAICVAGTAGAIAAHGAVASLSTVGAVIGLAGVLCAIFGLLHRPAAARTRPLSLVVLGLAVVIGGGGAAVAAIADSQSPHPDSTSTTKRMSSTTAAN